MNPRTIIILYDGNEPSQYTLTRVITELTASGIISNTNSVIVKTLNTVETENATKNGIILPKLQNQQDADFEKALTYILSFIGSNEIITAMNMQKAIFSNDSLLKNACIIVGNHPGSLITKSKIAKKMGINSLHFDAIIKVCNYIKSNV